MIAGKGIYWKKQKYLDTVRKIKTIIVQYEQRIILEHFCRIIQKFQL